MTLKVGATDDQVQLMRAITLCLSFIGFPSQFHTLLHIRPLYTLGMLFRLYFRYYKFSFDSHINI